MKSISADRLNECKVIRVRALNEDDTHVIVPDQEYDATVLENGSLLIGDGTGKANTYPADLFEVMSEEEKIKSNRGL